jgi:hypothetical protein
MARAEPPEPSCSRPAALDARRSDAVDTPNLRADPDNDPMLRGAFIAQIRTVSANVLPSHSVGHSTEFRPIHTAFTMTIAHDSPMVGMLPKQPRRTSARSRGSL